MMGSLTVTLLPSAVNSRNAKWTVSTVPGWHVSGATVALADGTYTVEYRSVDDYVTPASHSQAVSGATTKTTTYASQAWPASWGAPICGALFRGQVITGGRITAGTDDARRIRWSEIGAFRFFGATADTKKNVAGEQYLLDVKDEMVMAIIPLKTGVVVYSSSSIFLLEPVSAPAPTFARKPLAAIGIANPLACCSNAGYDRDIATEQICIDRSGNLRLISINQYNTVGTTSLGFQNIFSPMQESLSLATGKGMIAITYNPGEDEYYISNGERTYLYNKVTLTEIGTAITSYVDLTRVATLTNFYTLDDAPIGFAQALTSLEYIYLETDVYDFGLSSLKTVMGVDVIGSFGALGRVEVSVKWRNDRSGPWRITPWVKCSPEGFCSLIVSGSEFKFCIRVTPVSGTSLNSLTVEWKLTDKRGVRGNYAGSTSSDTGG